jgi:hypothetical protein
MKGWGKIVSLAPKVSPVTILGNMPLKWQSNTGNLITEIDEIPWEEKIEKISLPAAECAIYLELEHHLYALDMTIKRGKKTDSNCKKHVTQSLGDSRYI